MAIKIRPMANIKKTDMHYKISVKYAYPIRDFLKSNGYRYDLASKDWYKNYRSGYDLNWDWMIHDYHNLSTAGVIISEELKKTVDTLLQPR